LIINLLKFIHVLLAISLLGIAIFCFAVMSFKKSDTTQWNKLLILLSLFALLTGTLLVLPKHFTFQTPWIQAAYILVMAFGLIVSLTILLKKKFSIQQRWIWVGIYSSLVILLIVIIHDAVTKSTFLL